MAEQCAGPVWPPCNRTATISPEEPEGARLRGDGLRQQVRRADTSGSCLGWPAPCGAPVRLAAVQESQLMTYRSLFVCCLRLKPMNQARRQGLEKQPLGKGWTCNLLLAVQK